MGSGFAIDILAQIRIIYYYERSRRIFGQASSSQDRWLKLVKKAFFECDDSKFVMSYPQPCAAASFPRLLLFRCVQTVSVHRCCLVRPSLHLWPSTARAGIGLG